ncbi:MAG: hypothetical protein CML17_06810 [Pusillimonas sp.]|nr:hypothetical protein [Pusillimonas sp.]
MAILSKGNTFATGDQVTALKLNNLVDNSTFASGAVDDSTTQLDGSGRIIVKDGGITSAKLNLSATGQSQNIARFIAVQDSGNRTLNIRTPADSSDNNSPFELQTGNAIKLMVDSSSMELNSNGTAKIRGQASDGDSVLQLISTSASDSSKLGFGDDSDSDTGGIIYSHSDNSMRFATNTSERVRIDSSGNVGIGKTNPGTAIHIENTSENQITLVNTSGDFSRIRGERGLVLAADYDLNSGAAQSFMAFETDNVERVRIDSSGNVLIGTTTVDGTGGASFRPNFDDGAARLTFNRANTTNNSAVLKFQNNGSDVGEIVHSNTATSYGTSSDYRLKEDILEMQDSISRVQALKPVNFAWKIDGSRVDGFLAHEAQEVVPEAVTGTKDAVDEDGQPDYQGIDQSKLVPLLTKALQEALTKIESLEARVAALES